MAHRPHCYSDDDQLARNDDGLIQVHHSIGVTVREHFDRRVYARGWLTLHKHKWRMNRNRSSSSAS
jgi:hypothetical protein